MRKQFFVLIAGICLAVPGLAMVEDEEMGVADVFVADVGNAPDAMPKQCDGLNLDAAQMKGIKDAHIVFMKEKNTHTAHLKNAMIDYKIALGSAESQRDNAVKAATDANGAVDALIGAKVMLDLKIMYDIVKPEQRASVLRCAMAMKQAKHAERMKKICQRKP